MLYLSSIYRSKFSFFGTDLGRGVERICLPARGLGAWEYQSIQVQMGKAKVTGLLYWEVAGYIPKRWIATKVRVGAGLSFD